MKDITKIRRTMKDLDFLELKEPVYINPGIYVYFIERIKGVISVYTGIFSDHYTPVKDLSIASISNIAKNI